MNRQLGAQQYQGKFETPDPGLPRGSKSGKLEIKGTDDAKWLWIDYKKGDRSLIVKGENENFRMVAGSKISFEVRKPSDGVTIEYRGEVQGEWVWTDPTATESAVPETAVPETPAPT